MARKSAPKRATIDPLLDFARLIAAGDVSEVASRLSADDSLATIAAQVAATRADAATYFLTDIAHYIYAGDTALHIAAAAFHQTIAQRLVVCGADCRARNRRGAEPLHYAADANHWNPTAQADVIRYLTSIGADPNARDDDGTTPLHRAVRTRSLSAVQALLEAGASATAPNGRGSTPLHLAVQTTGRGGSGSELAREQQEGIVRLLLARGAMLTDRDGRGRTAAEATTSERLRVLLAATSNESG